MNEDERREMIRRWGEGWHDATYASPNQSPTCGLWWTLTTLATAIALGLGFGGLLWLVLGGRA